MAKKKLNLCLGIDLGTTNSVVSYYIGEDYKIIENNDGLRITPSFVYIDENEGFEVGLNAKRRAKKSPKDVFSSFKRLMGLKFKELKNLNLPYKIKEGKNGMCEVEDSRGRTYDVIFLSSLILRRLKEDAEKSLKGEITKAVITVPAYFNNDQRNATKEAAQLAGLEVERLIVEPSAAATIASDLKVGKIMVYDLGGGTFDVSIIDKQIQEDQPIFEVLSTEGDTQLGGRDFDKLLFDLVDKRVQEKVGKSIYICPRAIIEVQEAVEAAKKQLSNKEEADIVVPYLDPKLFGFDEENDVWSVDLSISRPQFEKMVSHLLQDTMKIVNKALKDCELVEGDINEVILVGGMTRMPAVRSMLLEKFGENKLNLRWNPDEIVSLGAAQQGAFLYGFTDSAPVVINNLPLSLGIETLGGVFTKLLEKNRSIPCDYSEIFSTAEDNQTRVTISIFQGERPIAKDNHNLGSFDLVGIDAQPRGVAKIKVHFDVDENGILKVSAEDEKSGKSHNLEINFNLSEDQIKKMTKEAEIFKEEDDKRSSFVQKKTSLIQLKYNSENLLDEKLKDEEIHESLKDILKEVEVLLAGEDYKEIAVLTEAYEKLRVKSDEYQKLKHEFLSREKMNEGESDNSDKTEQKAEETDSDQR